MGVGVYRAGWVERERSGPEVLEESSLFHQQVGRMSTGPTARIRADRVDVMRQPPFSVSVCLSVCLSVSVSVSLSLSRASSFPQEKGIHNGYV